MNILMGEIIIKSCSQLYNLRLFSGELTRDIEDAIIRIIVLIQEMKRANDHVYQG